MKGLIPYIVAGVAIAGVAVAQTPTPQSASDIAPQTSEDSGPTRLAITVAVVASEDLKVDQGNCVAQGQPIVESPSVRLRANTSMSVSPAN